MLNTTILVPAYCKQYTSIDAAKAAWDKGADFRIKGGSYCSIRDLAELQSQLSSVYIYLANLGKSFIVSTH